MYSTRSLLTVLLLLTACGEVKQGNVDAGSEPDAGSASDAGADAAAFGPVTVTYYYYGQVVPQATVLISDPADGTLIKEAVTGDDGSVVIADVPRGAMLTVGKIIGNAPRVVTVVGVEPGDELRLGPLTGGGPTTKLIATSTEAGIQHYDVGAGCNSYAFSTASPIEIEAPEACRRNNQWTLVAVAYSDQATRTKWTIVAGASDRAPTALTNWKDLNEMNDFIVGFSNRPAGATEVQVAFDFPYPIGSDGFQRFTEDSGNALFRYPPNLPEIDELRFRAVAVAGVARTTVFRHLAPTRMDNVNFGFLALPLIEAFAGDFTDKVRPSMTWSAAPAGADLVHLSAIWNGTGFYDWQVFAPPSVTAFRVPVVPPAHNDLVPPAGATWFFDGTVEYVDLETGGFADARLAPAAAAPTRTTLRTFNIPKL